LQIIVRIFCWALTKGFEQALAFCWCQPVCICHRVPLHVLQATQQPGNHTATCASEWVYCTNTPPSLYWLKTYSLQDADDGSQLTAWSGNYSSTNEWRKPWRPRPER